MALGYPHPDYLLFQLTASQLDEWWQFYKLQPFGINAWKTRLAYGFHLIAAGNYDEKFSRRDFMQMDPYFTPPEPAKPLSFEEQWIMTRDNFRKKN